MQFTHYNLNFQNQGTVVEVSLQGTECNVMLLDSNNFNNYRQGRRCHYHGGHTKQSIVRIKVPHSGIWNLVVDLGGYRGQVNSSVRVIE